MFTANNFTANTVHVYRKFCLCLPQNQYILAGGFRPSPGLPAGQLDKKNIFSEGTALRSEGGDLGGDGAGMDASRTN